jgi:hypothetical protein
VPALIVLIENTHTGISKLVWFPSRKSLELNL